MCSSFCNLNSIDVIRFSFIQVHMSLNTSSYLSSRPWYFSFWSDAKVSLPSQSFYLNSVIRSSSSLKHNADFYSICLFCLTFSFYKSCLIFETFTHLLTYRRKKRICPRKESLRYIFQLQILQSYINIYSIYCL